MTLRNDDSMRKIASTVLTPCCSFSLLHFSLHGIGGVRCPDLIFCFNQCHQSYARDVGRPVSFFQKRCVWRNREVHVFGIYSLLPDSSGKKGLKEKTLKVMLGDYTYRNRERCNYLFRNHAILGKDCFK